MCSNSFNIRSRTLHRTNPSQQWQHAEENINPIIHETHPKLTLDDVKLSKKEFTENPISVTATNLNFSYNWGQLYTKHNDAKYCVTAKGLLAPLAVETCKSVVRGINPSQYFELTINYTLLLFNSTNCINSFSSNSVLLPCNKNSQIWGKSSLTGQIMNENRITWLIYLWIYAILICKTSTGCLHSTIRKLT